MLKKKLFVEKTDSCCKESFLEKEIDFLENYVHFFLKTSVEKDCYTSGTRH